METSISGNLLPRTFPALHWNTGQSMVANEVLLQVSIKMFVLVLFQCIY